MQADAIGAVVLAGGFGTRIRELYPLVPKPMIEVQGLPFIEWVIRYLASQGIVDICLSVGYKGDVIGIYINNRTHDGLNISTVAEVEPQGTAGAFLLSAAKLAPREYYLAANGDSLILADLRPAYDALLSGLPDAVIIGLEVDDCSRFGSLDCDEQGFLLSFREKQTGAGLINAGIYLFRQESLSSFPPARPLSFEYDVFPCFLRAGMKIKVVRSRAPFIDIGTPETIGAAAAFIKDHVLDRSLQKGGALL